MSVSIERYIGYFMDCTSESMKSDYSHNYEFKYSAKRNLHESQLKELENLGFRFIDCIDESHKDYITLIVDGMNGNYVYLAYIESRYDEFYNLSDESDKIINKSLSKTPIPSDIQDRLERCYEIIFKDNDINKRNDKEIVYQQFSHWV